LLGLEDDWRLFQRENVNVAFLVNSLTVFIRFAVFKLYWFAADGAKRGSRENGGHGRLSSPNGGRCEVYQDPGVLQMVFRERAARWVDE
jgi:hypothetical protein